MNKVNSLQRVVVIGAGQAAAQLATSLRQGGHVGEILVIGEEPYLPYQRPPLSKKFLTERPAPESLYLRPDSFWRDQRVDMVLGAAVGAINLHNKMVTLTTGAEFAYERLVFATGTCARILPLPGLSSPNVFSLRTTNDARAMRPALDLARRVLIVGAGYIGLEVAAVMRGEGRAVTVVEAEDRVLKRVTSPVTSAFFDALHRERGTDLRLGTRLAGIMQERTGLTAALAGGETIAADVALLATGARANDQLAAACGVACDDGILVDEYGRTSIDGVYAIGDCTRLPSQRYARRIRLESVQNAIDQAKAAAATILGHQAPYNPVPWFWSDQFDVKLQIAGLCDGYDCVDTVGEASSAKFSVEYRRGGRLIAVDAVNDPRAHMMARRRIAEETAADVAAFDGAA
ncbi:NAD(P)/FAD-dependent oxidoreductase [Pseudolabrys sp. FHR47]|uniref:NAD(P)/FAD-dependent oxidoreductase n=1 Tax=Pseudolabrys sp. FHR47 TaxID=2562284 RepID=UPI0010BF5FE6|nr:FAD-dependent oxidoreductase [Pseudolabrys sp. FHR47]